MMLLLNLIVIAYGLWDLTDLDTNGLKSNRNNMKGYDK